MLYHKLNYLKIGNGKHKVVFLHGWGANGKTFVPIANSMQNCTCYLIDLYGFGATQLPMPMDTYDYAMQLYLFFVSHGINNFTLVGHSFGGRIAIILSSIFNLKINKLVLVSSAGLKPKHMLFTKIKVKSYKFCKYMVKIHVLPPRVLKKFGSKDWQQANSWLRITMTKVVNQYLDYLTQKIICPTLIVWGTKDKTTPTYMARRLNRNIANSRVIFYKSNHFVYVGNYNFCASLNNFVFGR
ncbi:MAG: alpha/beta hydrolase [Clostridia bacterium]|nr:alpha/beta hydrolase [Clostridia bacterium]